MTPNTPTPAFFARHETFCPRYGWLKKGFDQVAGTSGSAANAHIFDQEDAIEKLGVGKNMVRAMRFWCMAFNVIEPENPSSVLRIGGPMRASEFGSRLLADDGWDPYLEDPASLWLLHWMLFTPPQLATAWGMALNRPLTGAFSLADLALSMREQQQQVAGAKRFSDSSFQKDASCFIRMYAPAGTAVSEEIECPFTGLGLLAAADAPQTFRFSTEDRLSLPDSMVLAACCAYAARRQAGMSIALNSLCYGENSPGMVFRLSESALGNRLERLTARLDGVEFSEFYGNRQLQFQMPPQTLYAEILETYYRSSHTTGYIE